MFSPKWPAPRLGGKLRKILDRSVTPYPNKDANDRTEITEETTTKASPSGAVSHHHAPHLQEHPSLAETNSQAAFNHILYHEFNDLFFFACNQTLSGENVLFLRLVQCWKACWSLISLDTEINIKNADAECPLRRKIFSVAVEMYCDFINPSTACKAPLNLDYGIAATLDTILGDAAMSLPTATELERAAVAPFILPDRNDDITGYHDLLGMWWDLVSSSSSTDVASNNQENLYEKPLPALPTNPTAAHKHSFRLLKMKSRVSKTAVIPETFCKEIFDHVESSVYVMVLRDTFPKYISWCKLKDAESGCPPIKHGGKFLKKRNVPPEETINSGVKMEG